MSLTIWKRNKRHKSLTKPEIMDRFIFRYLFSILDIFRMFISNNVTGNFKLKTFFRLQEDPPTGVSGAPTDNNILIWNAVIFG